MAESKNPQKNEPVKISEKALGEEAEIFKQLVSAVQDYAIFALDPKGYILTWNAGAERLKGYSANEIIGSHFSRFYTREDIARNHPEQELKIATRTGVYEEEGWRVKKGGSRFWANVVITALKDSQGNLRGFAKVTRDLTEKKLADEKLRQSEEQLRLANESLEAKVAERTMQLTELNRLLAAERSELQYERSKLFSVFAQAPVGICVLEGPEHIFSIVNPTYSSLFFGGRDDFIGRSVQEAVPEAAKQGFVDILNRVYQTGEPFVGNEVPIDLIQRSGKFKRFHLNFVYQPLRDSDGKIYGIVAVVQDVSEQVQSRATLETIFQESPAAMVLWKGPELIFDKINPGYQAIFSNRELLGKPFAEALPETKGQPFEQWIKYVFESGETRVQPEQLAKLILYEGGPIEDRYFDMSFVRVMGVDDQPYGVYEHAVDVTDRVLSRRAIEQGKAELEVTVKSLEQEREMRERFVATLTHDLRTPLTAAKMSAQLILRKAVENQDLQKLAIKVADNMDRADEMIRDLLDANLIRAGEKLPIETVPSDLREIVVGTIDDLSTVYGDRFIVSADQPVRGSWSPNGIRRILENLCSNAIKYGAFQRPIDIAVHLKNDVVDIEVSNEGPPIPLVDQKNLFEPFHRTSSAKTGGQKGWGLGLTLVKGIAEAHGGRVGVASSDPQGTTFTVSLPVGSRS